MATKRKDGRWQTKTKIQGKTKYFYGSTPEEAEQAKTEALEATHGPRLSAQPTYAEFIYSLWWPNRAEGIRPSSRIKYDGQMRNHILPALGHTPIDRIGLADLMRLKASLSNKGNAQNGKGKPVSNRETFQILALAKSSLEFARRAGYTTREDWKLLGMPTFKSKKQRVDFPENLVAKLLALCDKLDLPWMKGPIWTAGVLGLRRGEICGLYKSDLDQEARTLEIRRQRQRLKGLGTIDRDLKTDESGRELPLTKALMETLWSLRSDHDLYFFAGAFGYPLKPDRITEAFIRIRNEDETIPKTLVFHDLRSHAASNLLDLGVDLTTIMMILGQSKIDTTMLYIEINKRQKAKALTRLSRSLTPKTPSKRVSKPNI